MVLPLNPAGTVTVNGNLTVPSYTFIVLSENANLRFTPRGYVTPLTRAPVAVRRTDVGIAYCESGRLELTCKCPGIESVIAPRVALPRAAVPLPIEPLTVCAETIVPRNRSAANDASNLIFILVLFRVPPTWSLYIKMVEHRFQFAGMIVKIIGQDRGACLDNILAASHNFELFLQFGVALSAKGRQ